MEDQRQILFQKPSMMSILHRWHTKCSFSQQTAIKHCFCFMLLVAKT